MDATTDMQSSSGGRVKFIVGGILILAAVIYLIASSTSANAQYYVTVDELISDPLMSSRDVRVSGAVIGETIEYDPNTLTLTFTVANMPADLDEIEALGGLAKVLHDAVSDPTLSQIQVEYTGPKPDLLQHEAQAIMTGRLGDDGIFQVEELLLKCPTRYEEYTPDQVEG